MAAEATCCCWLALLHSPHARHHVRQAEPAPHAIIAHTCLMLSSLTPVSQGRSWLLSREAKNGLRVTQLNDKHFRNILEECLTFGK